MHRRRTAYSYRQPYRQGRLDVGGGHCLYYEESGRPDGRPVVVLHGGPGSGSRPKQRAYFDPERFRIILFDQRGCGRSTPHGSLDGNTTPKLIADMEALRHHLDIERWLVFGGSWGSTLGIAYAVSHPARVDELIVWGVFLGTAEEIAWTFGPGGAARLFPREYDAFLAPLAAEDRADPVLGHYQRMRSADQGVRTRSLDAWTRWENKISDLVVTDAMLEEQLADRHYVLTHSLFEAHYFVNGCFLRRPLLEAAHRLSGTAVTIVQGELDLVCPATTAHALHGSVPGSRLRLVPGAGHSPNADMIDALVRAVDGTGANTIVA